MAEEQGSSRPRGGRSAGGRPAEGGRGGRPTSRGGDRGRPDRAGGSERGRGERATGGERPRSERSTGGDRGRSERTGSSDRGRGDRDRTSRPRSDGPRDERGVPDAKRGGGSRLVPTSPRLPEPAIPDEVTGKEVPREVHHQLRTLSKENAEGVAKHLVMVAAYLGADELDAALAHAETAVRRAGRVPAAREALGLVAYRRGDFARALTEFRTVRRLGGSHHVLPLMVDCERGLGRLERALELASGPDATQLDPADKVELAIVVSGVRRDLGQLEAALLALQIPQLKRAQGYPRLQYAYADALLALGRTDDAREWFARAADADIDLETDAAERLDELDGIAFSEDELR